jgi:hypothetical protein
MGKVMICSRLGYSSFPIETFVSSVVSLFGYIVIRKYINGDRQITIKWFYLIKLCLCGVD